jgi:hypothetical protein
MLLSVSTTGPIAAVALLLPAAPTVTTTGHRPTDCKWPNRATVTRAEPATVTDSSAGSTVDLA